MRALGRLVVAAALLVPTAASANLETEVKAAYLLRFLSYVEWPEQAFSHAGAPIVIGVLGAGEVEAALREIAQGRTAQGRPVVVERVEEETELPRDLHLLFVGRSAADALPRLVSTRGVLVVSEVPGALERGAMVNLVRLGEHVRFEVATGNAERGGLRISSRMLAVAQQVKPGSP